MHVQACRRAHSSRRSTRTPNKARNTVIVFLGQKRQAIQVYRRPASKSLIAQSEILRISSYARAGTPAYVHSVNVPTKIYSRPPEEETGEVTVSGAVLPQLQQRGEFATVTGAFHDNIFNIEWGMREATVTGAFLRISTASEIIEHHL